MDVLFDQLTVGTQEVIKLNEAAYSLPMLHKALYQKSDAPMKHDTVVVMDNDASMKEVGPRKAGSGNRCKVHKKRAEKCKKRQNVAIKTKYIRALRQGNNNVEKCLHRFRRRKNKEERMMLCRKKRQRKTAMRNLKIGLESCKL